MISRAQSGCWRACGAERGASVARAPQSLQRGEAPRGLKCEVLSVEKKLATGAPRPMAVRGGACARVASSLCLSSARPVATVERDVRRAGRSPRPRGAPQPARPAGRSSAIRCSRRGPNIILPETLLPYNTHARPSWHSHLKHVGSARRSLLSEPRRAHRTAADAPRTSATRAPLSIAKASVPV